MVGTPVLVEQRESDHVGVEPGGGSSASGVASANPDKLVLASQAADWLAISLSSNVSALEEDIVRYNQSAAVEAGHAAPVSLDLHAGEFAVVIGKGDDIDLHLVRVAAAFSDLGSPAMGPMPSDIVGWPYTAADDAISAEVDRWDQEHGMQFRQGDGGMEVQGPDGHWYPVVDRPPPGAPPLGGNQETVDLGNPDFGFNMSAAIIYGLAGGGSTHHGYGSMPPGAYENIHFDENGRLVPGPEVGENGPPPMHPPAPGDAGGNTPGVIVPGSGGGWGNIQGGLAAATEHASSRHDGVHHMQTTYYVDPETGERVAVVNAAKMMYSSDEIIIREGRLTFDENGEPEVVHPPPPGDPSAPSAPLVPGFPDEYTPPPPPPGEDWAEGYPGSGPPPPRPEWDPREPPPPIPPAEHDVTEHRIPIER